jgi:hypothetical protein
MQIRKHDVRTRFSSTSVEKTKIAATATEREEEQVRDGPTTIQMIPLILIFQTIRFRRS